MKQFLIAASLLISATCFSQHDTRTVGGCGFRTEETAFSTLALMACPNQDETVASYNVYGQGSGWCWTVTFICTGINLMDQSKNFQSDKFPPQTDYRSTFYEYDKNSSYYPPASLMK